MTTPAASQATSTTAPTPAPEQPKVKTFTEEQVRKKLEGQGKALSAKEQEIADLQAKLAAAQGTTDELHAKTREELAAIKAERDALAAEKTERVKALKEHNAARIAALPEVIRDLVDVDLFDANPDAASRSLAKFEAKAAALAARVGGVGDGQPHAGDAKTPDQEEEERAAAIKEKFHGKRD